jgi:Na+/pantothenate symporter
VFGGIGALFFVIIIAGIWWSRYKKKNGIGVSAHPRGLKPQR